VALFLYWVEWRLSSRRLLAVSQGSEHVGGMSTALRIPPRGEPEMITPSPLDRIGFAAPLRDAYRTTGLV
jgi:hypothetical protein